MNKQKSGIIPFRGKQKALCPFSLIDHQCDNLIGSNKEACGTLVDHLYLPVSDRRSHHMANNETMQALTQTV